MPNPILIAIDGPSASGKGTVARKLAAHFGFPCLDTGLLYRATALAVIRNGGNPENPAHAEQAAHALAAQMADSAPDFSDAALRSEAASNAASAVAAIPAVRAALLQAQRDFCAHPPGNAAGAVLDGRDIGTVIAPHARVKIFVTASVQIRAERRYKELLSRGQSATYDIVLTDLVARDRQDAERAIAPTKPAPDAIILDTTELTVAQSFAVALEISTGKGVTINAGHGMVPMTS